MKKLTAILLLSASVLPAWSVTADYSSIIPRPASIELAASGKNASFQLTSKTRIVVPANDVAMMRNARFLAEYLEQITGKKLKIVTSSHKGSAINLAINPSIGNREGYKLTVGEKSIDIQGSTPAGVFYGIQTLRKSLPIPKSKKEEVAFPQVCISDAPRFAYRGAHLDCSRHFFTADSVKQYIDILALHNINKFHWHLSDDQGWRIEIKSRPRLAEIGSQRSGTQIGRNVKEFDSIPYGGFYTQEQLRDIVRYAADRNISIIPEIDMPGHMLGALAAYPEMGCQGKKYEVWKRWGVSKDVLCAGNDSVYSLVRDVLREVCDIFPSEYIHVGGDECPKDRWKKCPKCQAKIASLGLQTDSISSAEAKLQSYFMKQASDYLATRGRKTIGWDEIMEGGLAPGTLIMSWRGEKGGIKAAQLGHDVIMTPNTHLYFDFYQVENPVNEPLAANWSRPITLEKVYNYEPIPATFTPEQAAHILGLQANVWCEYIPNMRQVQYMALPRFAALSEVQWSSAPKDYADFLRRLPALQAHYTLAGYNHRR